MEKSARGESDRGRKVCQVALEAVDGAEALVIATEWSEFASVDLADVQSENMTPIVFDGRTCLIQRQ